MAPPRSAWRLSLGALAAALGVRAVLAGGLSEATYSEDWRPPGAVHRVEIDADMGEIDIVVGERLRVQRAVTGPPGALNLRHSVTDGVLRLSGRCRAWLGCEVRHQLVIPAQVKVVARLGAGRARVKGVRDLVLHISHGTAEVEGAVRAEVTVGEGSLSLAASAPAALDLLVAAGPLRLGLPAGAWPLQAAGSPMQVDGITVRDVLPDDPALSVRAPGGPLLIGAVPPASIGSGAAESGAAGGAPW